MKKTLGFVSVVVVGVLGWMGTAFAATDPTTISAYATEASGLVTDNAPLIGTALVGIATATLVLAVGRRLISKVYRSLSSLGARGGV